MERMLQRCDGNELASIGDGMGIKAEVEGKRKREILRTIQELSNQVGKMQQQMTKWQNDQRSQAKSQGSENNSGWQHKTGNYNGEVMDGYYRPNSIQRHGGFKPYSTRRDGGYRLNSTQRDGS